MVVLAAAIMDTTRHPRATYAVAFKLNVIEQAEKTGNTSVERECGVTRSWLETGERRRMIL